MNALERVTLDDLRYPVWPERAPVAERWGRVRQYADRLEEAGEITAETKRRMLQTVGRWFVFEIVATRLGRPTYDFNRKIVRYLRRFDRKLG